MFQLPDQQQWDQRCVYLDESAEYKAPGSLLTAPCRIEDKIKSDKKKYTLEVSHKAEKATSVA